jgi:amino acid adenylation domain-containing protein
MTASELLQTLRSAGVDLWADGERLRYDAPEEALSDELLARIRAHKPEILALVRDAPPRPERIPLSLAQEAFWLLNALYPGHAGGNEQFAIVLGGLLDPGALAEAWRRVVVRHDILRARFASEDGACWQRIVNEPAAAPLLIDLTNGGEELRALATRALSTPFDLERGPLLRALLLRRGPESHLLLVTVHHIVADGLSVPVIRDDLAAFYERLCAGLAATDIGAAGLQYPEFAIRQRQEQSAARLAPDLEWWCRRLEGAPPRHELPRLAAAATAHTQGDARRVAFTIGGATATRLRALAREQSVTFFTLLLAAFRVLLARYGAGDDVLISSPVTLRDDARTQRMVGCLINNVVFRTPTTDNPRFTELLGRERSTVLGVLDHRSAPFARVIEALDPPRVAGEQPLSQIMFQFDSAPSARVAAGVSFDICTLDADRQSYWDLECSLTDHGDAGGLTGQLCYATAIFESWLIDAMPRRFVTLLDGIAESPERRLSELPVLDAADRHRILGEWNATAASYPADATLHELVRRQCRRSPDAVALRDDGGVISYSELETRVAAVSAELRALGAGPGERVALSLAPSASLVIGLLAILRAGAAFVPLDPAYPRARREFMLRDSGARLLLTERGVAEDLELPGVTRVEVDGRDWSFHGKADAAPPPGETLAPDVPVLRSLGSSQRSAPASLAPHTRQEASRVDLVTPDSPAYLLYTSGSTGEPKGAIGLHRGAVNRCHWMWRAHGFQASDVFCLRTSVSFVDSLWEIFGALIHGAELVILPGDTARDPALLVPALARHGITQIVLVPPLLRALLDFAPDLGRRLPRLRHVITSGEPLPPELLAAVRRALPAVRLLNTYGTSEIWDATCWDGSTVTGAAGRVPIGRPIANLRCYVLDGNLQPVPEGVRGELCVAGAGLGAGYWQRRELTASRFVADPFASDPAARLYRSGDLARFLPDGTLECLGRLDRQMKLRGFRVEPDEIETLLRGCDGVADAAVVLREDDGAPRLVAYVAAAPGGVDCAALEAEARRWLPEFMLPSAWVLLTRLPLTPSGKLDRDVLPPPAATPARASRRAPADELEARLLALWSAVLGRKDIGPDDNFFDLGGQSLLAMRLVARAAAALGTELTLRDLFEAPTAAALAERIRGRPAAPVGAPALQNIEHTGPLPLSWGQERLWFLGQLDPASPAYNIAWTIAIRGPLDAGRLQRALDIVVARHELLRAAFPSRGGQPVVVIAPELRVPIAVEAAARETAPARRDAVARLPFDLGTGPLLRACLLRLADDEHELVIAVHHIVTDGASNGILFAELTTCYEALTSGNVPALAPLPLRYADFAAWQRRALAGESCRRELDYWQSRLQGAPAALALPTDFPRPAESRFHGAWVWRSLPAAQTAALRGFARRHSITPYLLMLAAFKVLLCRYSGERDIVVGTPVSARPDARLDGIVGLFVNTVVLRTDAKSDSSFGEFLDRVRATMVSALAHRELPFERLVEGLTPERSLARAPVFQVMFNLVTIPERARIAGGAEFRLGRLLDLDVSPFDLTLTVGEHADELELIFEFDTDLFRRETIEAVADAYGTLLEAAMQAPAERISQLPLLTPARAAELSARLTGTSAHAPVTETALEILARQVAARPGSEAVAGAGARLSYAALDTRANRIAHALAIQGCGCGQRVGVCLPRSPDLIAALLGVMKAGAAYVLLDPDYPPARLRRMAQDAGLALVVTAGGARPATDLGVPIFDLDAQDGLLADQPVTVPEVAIASGDLAYVVYTSGSSGDPKGVTVSHANIAATFRGWEQAYALGPDDVHLQLASAAFDVFTGDWLRALLSGARLVLCARDVLLEPARLHTLLVEERVTVAEFVPAVIRPLMAHLRNAAGSLAFMRLLIVGSEPWHSSEYRELRSLCGPATRVINSYGVAEATIDSTWFEGDDAGDGMVPIGWPFPQAAIRILDDGLQPLPPGVPGELVIGGAGVAAGYWRRPQLTAERFIEQQGRRLYRTGDRARLLSDGRLQLLGRLDRQVKLRGFRIEPEEVESVLSGLSGVSGCVVGVREVGPGDARLVAWVVAREGIDAGALRAGLSGQLPEYMVPAAFVLLPALPLTPNGKVDRQGLPAPVWGSAAGAGYVAPRDAVEEALCGLFAEVLGGGVRVGIEDDFFALGGHSLLATRLVSRIRDSLAVELPLRALFERATVGALAELVRRPDARMKNDTIPRLTRRDRSFDDER